MNATDRDDISVTRLLTTAEVAELLRLQRQTIARWRRERRGPLHMIVGGRVLYPADEIERFLRDRQRAGEH